MVGSLAHAVSDVAAHGRAGGDKSERRILANLGGELDRRVAYLILWD
jgi:hypothetical protein